MIRPPPTSTLFPYTTLFRSASDRGRLRATAETSVRRHRFEACTALAQAQCMLRTCARSEEHTSELQSLRHLVCRLLLEKKNKSRGLLLRHHPTFSHSSTSIS